MLDVTSGELTSASEPTPGNMTEKTKLVMNMLTTASAIFFTVLHHAPSLSSDLTASRHASRRGIASCRDDDDDGVVISIKRLSMTHRWTTMQIQHSKADAMKKTLALMRRPSDASEKAAFVDARSAEAMMPENPVP